MQGLDHSACIFLQFVDFDCLVEEATFDQKVHVWQKTYVLEHAHVLKDDLYVRSFECLSEIEEVVIFGLAVGKHLREVRIVRGRPLKRTLLFRLLLLVRLLRVDLGKLRNGIVTQLRVSCLSVKESLPCAGEAVAAVSLNVIRPCEK